MTFEELELIEELLNYSSFADASCYLPYSAATITKYVTNVERELGVDIFVRSNKTRHLHLTQDGEQIIGSIKRILDDYSFLKKQVYNLTKTDQQVLHLGSQSRFGNIHEQKILSKFMLQNPTAQVSMHKQPADDVIRGLIAGRIDIALITLNKRIKLNQYFGENRPRIESTFLVSEPDMYVGVSDEYFPGQSHLLLKDLVGFTMAVPFPPSNDVQSNHAYMDWQRITKEKNVEFQYLHLAGYDNTVFDMAIARKIAITTNNIPTVTYPGVHFLKVDDWSGGNNLFLVKCKGHTSEYIKQFEEAAFEYCESVPR